MPLVDCLDCGKQISSLAPHCIHCGRPMPAAVLPPQINRNPPSAIQPKITDAKVPRKGIRFRTEVAMYVLFGLGIYQSFDWTNSASKPNQGNWLSRFIRDKLIPSETMPSTPTGSHPRPSQPPITISTIDQLFDGMPEEFQTLGESPSIVQLARANEWLKKNQIGKHVSLTWRVGRVNPIQQDGLKFNVIVFLEEGQLPLLGATREIYITSGTILPGVLQSGVCFQNVDDKAAESLMALRNQTVKLEGKIKSLTIDGIRIFGSKPPVILDLSNCRISP